LLYDSSANIFDFQRFLAHFREAAREIETKSTLLALKGDWLGAIEMQANGFLVEKHAAQQPGIIGNLIALSVAGITTSGIQSLLTHAQPDASLCEAAVAAISGNQSEISFKRALQTDPPVILANFDEMLSAIKVGRVTNEKINTFSPADKNFFEDVIDAEEATYLNSVCSAVEVADEPPVARRASLAELLISTRSPYKQHPGDPIISSADEGFDPTELAKNLAQKNDLLSAREQVLLAGAQVLAVKAKTGSFPAVLPGGFADPFTGKQLIYKLSGSGFVVYSVGPSGHFDGSSPQGKGDDSAFTYPASLPVPVPQDLLQN
jgi:hypothetical protein